MANKCGTVADIDDVEMLPVGARVNKNKTHTAEDFELVVPEIDANADSPCATEYDFNGFTLNQEELQALNAPSSLFVFSGNSIVRIRALQVVRSRAFQVVVLVSIIINSLRLGADWPSVVNPPAVERALDIMDDAFTVLFTIEATVKIVAFGFVLHAGAYMRSGWNVMDFVIIVISWVQFFAGQRALSGMRAVRVFRPLRTVSRVPKLKQLVGGLIRGLPQVLDNLILFLFVIILFAMGGVQLFMDSLSQRCYIEALAAPAAYPNVTVPVLVNNDPRTCGGTHHCELQDPTVIKRATCSIHRDVYTKENQNYDNIFSAMILVLKITVNDNWPEDLDALTNATGYAAIGFFVLLITFGTWYCVNLFLAILTTSYAAKDDDSTDSSAQRESAKRDKTLQVDIEHEKDLFQEISRMESMIASEGAFASHFGYFEFIPGDLSSAKPTTLVGQMQMCRPKQAVNRVVSFGATEMGFTYLDVFHDDTSSKVCPALLSDIERLALDEATEEPTTGDDVVSLDEASMCATRLEDDRAQWRKLLGRAMAHAWWEALVMIVTVANVLALSIDYYGISDSLASLLNIISLCCTGMFALDVMLKLVAYGPSTYIALGMNRLDLLLVVASVPDIVASGGQASAFSAIRVFRLFRLIRLMRSIKPIQALILCVIHSISAAALLLMLLIIFLYIYAILGMQLFGVWYNEKQSDPNVRDSFGTLWEAALACFIVVTGDNWTSRIFLDGADTLAGKIQNVAFFVSLFIIGNYVFLNLFVAILLDSLSEMMEKVEQNEAVMPNLVLPAIVDAHRLLGNNASILSPHHSKKNSSKRLRRRSLADEKPETIEESEIIKRTVTRRGFHDELVSQSSVLWNVVRNTLQRLIEDRGVIVEGNALFVLSPTNPIRRLFLRIVTSAGFDLLIDGVLIVNVIAIAMQSPLLSDSLQRDLDMLNVFLTWFFVGEMALKMFAFGVWWPEGELKKTLVTDESSEWLVHPAYLRVGWNVVDFVVVAASILSQIQDQFKVLRSFRTVRLIHRVPPMRTVVLSLIQALPQMLNAFGLVLFLLVVFTIMGVQFFKGKFYKCSDPMTLLMEDCVGNYTSLVPAALGVENVTLPREWTRLPFHFDHFGASLTSIFVIGVGDGWSSIMYNAMDTTTIGGGLSFNASPQYCLFFVIVYTCCNFCALQMLVGVLINYFQKMKELNDGSAVLTPQQRLYVHARHAIEASAIVADEAVPEPFWISQWIHRVYTFRIENPLCGVLRLPQPIFEYVSFVAVIANTGAIAYTHSAMTAEEEMVLGLINLACLSVFTAEMLFIMLAYFPSQYFSAGWNVLDFAVICIGWLDLALPNVPGVTFVRVIRVSKLLRGTGVEKLILTTVRSYQSFLNALLMLILLLFIYAAIGVQLFGELPLEGALDENNNFQTLPNAMLVLFQIITTEGWGDMLSAVPDDIFLPGTLFYVSFMLIGYFTILQLFTAVVVDIFEQETDETDRIVVDFQMIRDAWLNTFGPVTTIACSDFIPFLRKIPTSLTELSENPRRVDIVHLLASLCVPISSSGSVEYNHIINALAWRRFNIEVRTIGGVIHGIVFDRTVHDSFTAGEAFCAEIVQTRWRDFVLRKAIGKRQYRQLEQRRASCVGAFLMPRQRSVHSLYNRGSSECERNTPDDDFDAVGSGEFAGGDTAIPQRHSEQPRRVGRSFRVQTAELQDDVLDY